MAIGVKAKATITKLTALYFLGSCLSLRRTLGCRLAVKSSAIVI